MKIREIDNNKLTGLLVRFAEINDIDPNIRNIDTIIEFLKEHKGHVFFNTFENALNKWSLGHFEYIKSRKLSVNFLGRIIEEYFKGSQKFNQPSTEAIPTNTREVNKLKLYAFADSINESHESAYGFLVRSPQTDTMNFEDLKYYYQQYLLEFYEKRKNNE